MAFKPLDDAPAGSVSFRPLDDTEATTPTAADYLKGAASGVGGLVSGIGYLAEAAGANQLGGSIRGIGDTTQRYWQDSMTPAGQRAAQSQVFDDDPGSALPKLGDRWGQSLAMGAAQSAPSMVAAAIPGGLAAMGLRGAAGIAASRGIGGALAPLAAGTAAPIGGWATNLAGNLAARVPTALGFGAAEGAVAGASNAAQWKSDIEQKPLAELRKMPGFAALEAQIGEQAARQQIAEQGAADIMARTTLATGGIGALTGGGALGSAFQRVTTGAKGGIAGAIGRDAAKEAGQEIPQSGGERAIQNIATRDYLDPNQPVSQRVVADALSGGAIGGLIGGVIGGASHLAKGPLQKAVEASSATVPPSPQPPAYTPPQSTFSEIARRTAVKTPQLREDQNTPADASVRDLVQVRDASATSDFQSIEGEPESVRKARIGYEAAKRAVGNATDRDRESWQRFINEYKRLSGTPASQLDVTSFSNVNFPSPVSWPDFVVQENSKTNNIQVDVKYALQQLANNADVDLQRPVTYSGEFANGKTGTVTVFVPKSSHEKRDYKKIAIAKDSDGKEFAMQFDPRAPLGFVFSRIGANHGGYFYTPQVHPARLSQKNAQQSNTPAAPGLSRSPVPAAASSLPTNQAEPAGVPVSQQQQGLASGGNQTEVAKPAGPGQQAQPAAVSGAAGAVGNTGTQPAPAPANTGTQPAKAADSAAAEREWQDFVASEGRDIGPRQLAVVRAQFMRRRMMDAGIEAATGMVEDARQREVAANRMAILEALPMTTTGNTIRRFAASLRDAGIRDSRVSPEERQLIARRIAARDTLQPLEQAPPNELALPEKQAKQAQPTMPRIDALRRRAATPGVRIVGNRMLDRHGKRLATLSDSEVSELLPKPQQQPARTVEDTELADFIKSESADLGKRRVTLRALQALRQQKQAEADKTDLEDLIEAERADLRERFARMQDAQAAARAKKPFVIPPLTTPAQPTTTRALEQKAADVPLGKYGIAAAVAQPKAKAATPFVAPPLTTREQPKTTSVLLSPDISPDTAASQQPSAAEVQPEIGKDIAAAQQPQDQHIEGKSAEPASDAKISYDEASPTKKDGNDPANERIEATVDQPLAEGESRGLRFAPARGARSDRYRPGRADDRGVRRTRRGSDQPVDESRSVGNGSRPSAIQHGQDGALAGGLRRVSADFRPRPGQLTRQGSWFDTAKRNIDLIELAIQIDKEKRNATADEQALLADNIETKRLNRQTVPTAWTTKLAEVDAKIRGESDPEAVYSMVVEGHPMFDGSPMLRNLIPIKVTSLADAERKLFAAQDLYSKLSGDMAKAKNALSVAKTAQQKKAAQKALQDLNNNGATEDAVNTLRQETLPELQRLVKAAEDKFGSAKPAPAPAAAPTEPTSNAGELPAAEASPDNTPASEPLENPEELPSADDRADKNTFSVQRIAADDQIETVSFERGEYVKAYVADGKYHDGEISGISQAMRQFKIGDSDIWYPFGAAYKAEKPKGKDKKPAVPLSSVLESVNKKFGDGLTEEDRIPEESGKPTRPIVEHVTAKGKTLRGTIRTDLTLDQARALDKYTFRKDGGYFIREAPTAGAAAAPEAKDAAPVSKPYKSKQQAERLRSTGEKLIESAQDAMSRDRLTNTARRARMASGAEAKAAHDELIGETMLRIADAIEDGRAESLAGVTSRAQIEQLDSIMQMAIYRADDKAGGYALTQKNKGRPLADADLAFVAMPASGQWISGARKGLIDGIAGKRGAPELRAEILRATGYTAEIHAKAKALLSDDEIKRAVGWSAVEGIERAARLARAGITNIDQLRKAIKEYAQIRAAKTEGNKAKALERALIGQKVGVDFFPTPSAVAADMVRRAGIKPGMRVLEPSAGNGNIAEAIQAAGVAPDVIEVSSSLREILDAKGFNLVGNDFMEASGQQYDRIVMNPPFSSRMDAEHVQHAYSLLKPGGKIVAIMGEGVFFGNDVKAVKFREWLDSVGGASEKLPQGTFTDRTLMATTGVSSRMVEISKPDDVRFNIGVGTASSPADRAIYSMAAEGKSADEILSFISKSSRRPFNRVLAAALRRAGLVSDITLDTASRFGKQQGAARYAAAYNPTTDTVALFTYRDAERHVLHELVHAATMKAIAGKGPSAVRMRALFRHVQKSGMLDGQYGMTDIDEFVAEAFSNPRFQDALRGIPAPAGSTLKSAWQWFVRIVARIVGIRTQPSETALDRALTVGAQLMNENAALAGRRGDGDTRYAIAWHGTPHVWPPEPGFPHGRPRLDKMGSGEGAQAYGWGWYSAEAQDVAMTYQPRDERMEQAIMRRYSAAERAGDYPAAQVYEDFLLHKTPADVEASIAEAGYAPADLRKAKAAFRYARDQYFKQRSGALYQLDIPDDVMPKLLDWDKPLSEQSPEVQNALREAEIANRSGQDLLQMDPTGEAIVSALGRDEGASEYLASLGIPGLRYLDGSSRSKGAGTYNYVIWDQKVLDRIALLERNGEKLDAIRAADEAVRFNLDTEDQFAATERKVGGRAAYDKAKAAGLTKLNYRQWVQVRTPAFKAWFGDWEGDQANASQVVDPATGEPLVVYHGTNNDFSAFHSADDAYYFAAAPDGQAAAYSARTGGNIMPVFLRVNNPASVDAFLDAGAARQERGAVSRLRAEGYDGVLYPKPHTDDDAVWITFRPEQIKSAIGNAGTFDGTDPDIRYNIAADWQTAPTRAATTIRQYVADSMRSDSNTSWLTPFNTQYHKSARWAAEGKVRFKQVFNIVQQFIADTSRFAVMSQNAAPALLHEIKSLRDVKEMLTAKHGTGKQHRADIEAIASPLYDGTLHGQSLTGLIAGGGDADPMKGVKWSDSLLRTKYNLTDRQIKLYHEALAAVKVSMDEMAKSLVARHAKRVGVDFDNGMALDDMVADVAEKMKELQDDVHFEFLSDEAKESHEADILNLMDMDKTDEARKAKSEFVRKQKDAKEKIAEIEKTIADIKAIEGKAVALQEHGYFPLMRFGRHTVTAKDAEGKTLFFGMYDGIPLVPRSGQAEANRVKREVQAMFPDATVETGIINDEKYKLYQGLNLDAMQIFAEHMDKDDLAPVQEFIRLATNSRSAMKRLMHREGTPGFDRDVRRTLAQFIVSNARSAASNYHNADMLRAAEEANKDGGDIGREAVRLVKYIQNPEEEAQVLRGFLFFQFLGGSIASAVVNLTQTPAMTLPFLSKFEPAGRLSRRLLSAAKMAVGDPKDIADAPLRDALMTAEMDGVTAPQEIHQLVATAANNLFAGSRTATVFLRGWGAPFAMAESFNRRIAFISAFQIAQGMGKDLKAKTGFATPFEFAEDAVNQTQGIYNKGNRMNVGRGAFGATVMTFKQFSIMYLELLKRLPPKQRAIMLGVLLISAGGGGLPGVEDAEDIWDTIGQWLGFASNSKRTIRNTLTDLTNPEIADLAINGLLSKMGIDLHSRLGMQNLLPGTAMLKQSSTDKGREITEVFGPAASVIKSVGDALEKLATGQPAGAAKALVPGAIRNAWQGVEMAATGRAEDARGRATVPVNEAESIAKVIGFNPKSVAQRGEVNRGLWQDQRLIEVKREGFTADIVSAILAGDDEAKTEAYDAMRAWNEDNPQHRVTINPATIGKRVREARSEGTARMVRALPKAMRQQAAEEFAR